MKDSHVSQHKRMAMGHGVGAHPTEMKPKVGMAHGGKVHGKGHKKMPAFPKKK